MAVDALAPERQIALLRSREGVKDDVMPGARGAVEVVGMRDRRRMILIKRIWPSCRCRDANGTQLDLRGFRGGACCPPPWGACRSDLNCDRWGFRGETSKCEDLGSLAQVPI